MRILILNWRDIKHPWAGGAEKATFEYAKQWLKKGHQVIWFASNFKNGKKEEIIEGIKVIRRGRELLSVHIAAFFWYFKYGRGKIDIIVDQFHGIPFFTPLYTKEKKIAFIHETAKKVWFLNHLPKPFNFFIGLFGWLIEPFFFRYIYRQVPFWTVSKSTKKDLILWGIPKENIVIIENGLKIKTLQPFPKKEKKPTIIFLGMLAKDKGIKDAIKAFFLISQQKKDSQFWIVGKGKQAYIKKLKLLIKKLNLNNKVKFFGFVSEKKKFELLAKAHILINPSVCEGWGLVVVEANAMGTPAVVYNVPGLRDSTKNGKTGLICLKNKPENLAENVLKLIKNNNLYKRLQKNAILWVKNFSWQKAGKKSLKLIEKI